MTSEQRQQHDTVKKGFDTFCWKENVINERAKFKKRMQQPNEAVDSFIKGLYALAEN